MTTLRRQSRYLFLLVGAVAATRAWAEPVTLAPRWPTGKRLVYLDKRVSKQTLQTPDPPRSMEQRMTQRQEFAISILREPPSGGYVIEWEFLSMRISMEVNGRTLSFDSSSDSEDPANPLASSMRLYMDSIYTLYVNDEGMVERVEGVQELVERLTNDPRAGQAILPGLINEETFKQMFAHTFNQGAPARPVDVGDTWNHRAEFPLASSGIALDLAFTFAGWTTSEEGPYARLQYEGTMEGGVTRDAALGFEMSIQEGRLKGVKLVDPRTGLPVRDESRGTIRMEMPVPAPNGTRAGSVTMQQSQSLSLLATRSIRTSGPAPKRGGDGGSEQAP